MRTITSLLTAAALALTLAACSDDGDTGTDDGAATTTEQEAEAGGEATGGALTFTGTADLAWESDSKSASAGSTEVTLDCGEDVPHGLAIEGVQDGAELAACEAGGSDTATVELEAGDYTFFCTVPGHRDAGMEGTLTVG